MTHELHSDHSVEPAQYHRDDSLPSDNEKRRMRALRMMENLGKLAQERTEELETYRKFEERAREIFYKHTEGIWEPELIHQLETEGAPHSVAAHAATELRDQGIAVKNWHTGLLTHVNQPGEATTGIDA